MSNASIMSKLRVGVWIDEDFSPEIGGGYSYYSQIVNAFYVYEFSDAEIVYISKKFPNKWDKIDKSYQIQTANFFPPKLTLGLRIIKKIFDKVGIQSKLFDYSLAIANAHEQLKIELAQVIDVIYYAKPNDIIENFPYIILHQLLSLRIGKDYAW